MNERIQELAEQAVYYDEDEESWEFDRKKFAELIVRECAEVSKNYAGGSMPLSIALAIKKHFGVEK
jgi:hypothetical protein